MKEPELIKAGDARLKLGHPGQPPLVDVRVIAEENYQELLKQANKNLVKAHVGGQLPLSTEQQRFIEWISLYDEWHWSSVRKQWEQEHYRSRNTQELFEYYLKRKTESGTARRNSV